MRGGARAQPILTDADLEKIRGIHEAVDGAFRTATLDATVAPGGSGTALEAALQRLCWETTEAVLADINVLILSDRAAGPGRLAIPAALACIFLVRRAHALDLVALGEDVAASLGHRPRRLALEVIALSAVAVGACVAVAGAIGFVGLVAPVLARRLTRGHPGRAMLPAALIGSILLTLADLAVRALPLDRPIPIGVVTALFGTPLFLHLIVTMRRGVTP